MSKISGVWCPSTEWLVDNTGRIMAFEDLRVAWAQCRYMRETEPEPVADVCRWEVMTFSQWGTPKMMLDRYTIWPETNA